jgi:hypothetical protein
MMIDKEWELVSVVFFYSRIYAVSVGSVHRSFWRQVKVGRAPHAQCEFFLHAQREFGHPWARSTMCIWPPCTLNVTMTYQADNQRLFAKERNKALTESLA